MLTFALVIIAYFVIVLSLIDYLWSTHVSDVIIIGNGPLACHFQALLQEVGLTSRLLLPKRQHQLGYRIANSISWTRSLKDEIIFPEPCHEELESLSDQYDLPNDLVNAAWKQLSHDASKYSQHEVFFNFAENLGTQDREVYSFQLKTSQEKRMDYHRIISIDQSKNIAKVKVSGDHESNLYARMVCLVEVSNEDLFEQYINLDQPCGARVNQSYISEVKELDKIGSFFEADKIQFLYHRNKGSGLTVLSSDVSAKFQPETGSYQVNFPITSLQHSFDLTNLPSSSFRVSHLFFPWRQQAKSPLILDTTNIISTSPERDLIIVMNAIRSKMLHNKLSS